MKEINEEEFHLIIFPKIIKVIKQGTSE